MRREGGIEFVIMTLVALTLFINLILGTYVLINII